MNPKVVNLFALIAAAGGAVCLIAIVFSGGTPLNHDCALFLQCAQLLLQGNVPYVDYVETNPPLVQYIHVVPVALAQWLGLNVAVTFQVFVLVLVLCSAAALFLVPLRSVSNRFSSRLFLVAAWLAFSIVVFASGGFGQREHLFILGYVPWLFCRLARHDNVSLPQRLSLPVGLIAGLFFLINPQYLLVVVAVELWLLYRTRRWSVLLAPEAAIVGGLALMYAAHLLLMIPASMHEAFFGRLLPFLIKDYDAYDRSTPAIYIAAGTVGGLLAFVVSRRTPPKHRILIEALGLSTLIATALYYVQHKGWLYHLYPMVGCLAILLTVSLLIFFESPTPLLTGILPKRFPLRTILFAILLIGLLGGILVWSEVALAKGPRRYAFMRDFIPLIQKNTGKDDRVAFISTSVVPAYPTLIYADRLPGTRYLVSFPIPMLYKGVHPNADGTFPYHILGTAPENEKRFLKELGSDIARYRPKLTFIQTSECQACPDSFRVDTYLAKSGWREMYLGAYRLMEHSNGFAVYRRVY